MSDERLIDRESRKRKREWIAIGLLIALFIALFIAEFKLSSLSSTLPFVNSIFFFGLLNVNIVILIALTWLVFRNIGKVFIERRRKVLGARLKTKLVIAFLAFSIIPTLALFAISATYINSSFDKWFSLKIQNTLQASLEITRVYYRNADQTAMHFSEHIGRGVGRRLAPIKMAGSGFFRKSPTWLGDYLAAQRELLALDAVEFYADSMDERVIAQRPGAADLPDHYPRISIDLLDKAFAGEKVSTIHHVGSGDLIRCLSPVYAKEGGPVDGVIVVNSYIPVSLVNKVDEIASVFDDYKDVNPLKYPMKTTYLVILIMITLVIIFVAIWIGLYMARELTIPVERLVYGAQQVGRGNLDMEIEVYGEDELSVLVDSFNKMTRDLKDNRGQLTQASADLEKRRQQLEAVLTNVGTGVIVVDRNAEITTFNRAVSQLLAIKAEDALGRRYNEILKSKDVEIGPLIEVIKRAMDPVPGGYDTPEVAQWSMRGGDQAKALAAVASSLREGPNAEPWGVVVVIDDMTLLIKGQREMAWREVARRIAHEIKNPLTPIKLSAQRLQRRLGDLRGQDGALLQECTETIIRHTDELKEMVNEFSNFARFPEATPAPHDLNLAVREVTSLYEQAHPDIRIESSLETKLPIFEFDRDLIKRVVINLLDNAVAALEGMRHKGGSARAPTVRIETHFNSQLKMAALIVKDNGPGMDEETKARVFEPYFSTKKEGTGLGLAIAKRIVNDHDGFIRVVSAPGEGTQFLIELPTMERNTQRQPESDGKV